jgi:putative redox protein
MVKVHKAVDGKLRQTVEVRGHRWSADVAPAQGGDDAGPDPHELLEAALGACTALTVTMVARRRQMPLEDVIVQVSREEADGVCRLTRQVELVGALDEAQREYLLGIAKQCPVHKTLMGRFEIDTSLAP